METVKSNGLTVEVFSDELYTLNSSDNVNSYDHVYIYPSVNVDHYMHIPKYGIRVRQTENVVCKAIIIVNGCVATSPHKRSMLIDNDDLILIIGNSVCSLSLPSLSMNWKLVCDGCVTCFEIYKFTDGYLVHGELSIFKVSISGKIDWEFFGRDIFTTAEGGEDDFQVYDDYILAKDWGYNKYKITKYGKSTD